jgi:hypothetical protein
LGTDVTNIYDFIHYQLIIRLADVIKNLDDLMVESLKFRFYLYQTISNDLYSSYYADCMVPFDIPPDDHPLIELQGSPLLPATDTTISNVTSVAN